MLRTGPLLPDLAVPRRPAVGVDIGSARPRRVDRGAGRSATPSSPASRTARSPRSRRAHRHGARRGAARRWSLGLLPVAVWLLLGRHRRGELFRGPATRRGAVGGVLLVVACCWRCGSRGTRRGAHRARPSSDWMSLADFLGPDVPLPDGGRRHRGPRRVTTTQTRRLVASAVDTYDKSKAFYAAAADAAAGGSSCASPRRARPSRCWSATGTTTSAWTRSPARSATRPGPPPCSTPATTPPPAALGGVQPRLARRGLRRLDRCGVAGNHDNGPFVHRYLADLGWTTLDGQVVDGPGGGTAARRRRPALQRPRQLARRDRPQLRRGRASGSPTRPATPTSERHHRARPRRQPRRRGAGPRLRRPRASAGHLHVQVGPTRVVGANGEVGYTYTNGTTGGAAYAIAVGSKPRRDAEVTPGDLPRRPPGRAPAGDAADHRRFEVGDYLPLDLTEPPPVRDPSRRGAPCSRHPCRAGRRRPRIDPWPPPSTVCCPPRRPRPCSS